MGPGGEEEPALNAREIWIELVQPPVPPAPNFCIRRTHAFLWISTVHFGPDAYRSLANLEALPK